MHAHTRRETSRDRERFPQLIAFGVPLCPLRSAQVFIFNPDLSKTPQVLLDFVFALIPKLRLLSHPEHDMNLLQFFLTFTPGGL